MKETVEFVKMLDRVERVSGTLPRKAATIAQNFSKFERFRAQNWVDTRTEPWPKRKGRQRGKSRNLLVQTGRLKQSIRKVSVTPEKAIIGTDVPYARVHNEGFRRNVTVSRHTRESRKGRSYEVKSHKRRMNIPQRKFLGASMVLDQRITRMMAAELTRAIKGG